MKTPEVKDPEAALGETIAVAMTLSTQIGEGRSLVLQTFIERDASVAAYHGALDKLGLATDRQKAKYDLQAVEISLAMHVKTLKQLEDDFRRIELDRLSKWQAQGKRGEVKLAPTEAAQKSQAEISIKRYREEILKLEAERDKYTAIIKDTSKEE